MRRSVGLRTAVAGADPGLPMRVLRALRSVNEVPPVIDEDDPIPPAPRAVLAGMESCGA